MYRTEYIYRCGHLVKHRRKLAWHEHKGVAFYDRERMRQPLLPIVHPHSFEDWATPLPSWIDPNWQAPDVCPEQTDDFDGPPIAETADYTLESCRVETEGDYRWELTFADGARFKFKS